MPRYCFQLLLLWSSYQQDDTEAELSLLQSFLGSLHVCLSPWCISFCDKVCFVLTVKYRLCANAPVPLIIPSRGLTSEFVHMVTSTVQHHGFCVFYAYIFSTFAYKCYSVAQHWLFGSYRISPSWPTIVRCSYHCLDLLYLVCCMCFPVFFYPTVNVLTLLPVPRSVIFFNYLRNISLLTNLYRLFLSVDYIPLT